MFYVIGETCLFVDLTELFNSAFNICAVIAEDLPRHACFLNGFFELLVDDLAIGLFHWQQCDRLDVFKIQVKLSGWQCALADTQNDQTLFIAYLNRMVNDPYPIIGSFFFSEKLVVADSH